MKDRMPPLQGLYYFFVAAKEGSFKTAAKELFVTPAAISQQIRHLEEFLGTDLFVRQHRKIVLTPEGELLFSQAERGFAHLQQGVRLINQDPNPNHLSISTLPSFAHHWLVPKITAFRQRHPDIALLLEPTNDLVSFQDSQIDLCVRYGLGKYPNLESQWLMDEAFYPACHPVYQKEHGIYNIEDLSKAELIEDVWPDLDWNMWLATLGHCAAKPTLKYSGSHLVLEAALSLQGVALVKHSLAHQYFRSGKLVRIGDIAIKPNFAYYLCAPKGYLKRPKAQLFAQWLKEEIEIFEKSVVPDFKTIDLKGNSTRTAS
ncbi:LysR substrate-binding domain-containing protein [Vibrio alginolyticus]|uniref:LysR substrate-binding domain-containing protein n=1 Tax=Vibrio TaxID=662 RepID=UPI001A8D90E2|nr:MULTISPECIES: LysR substrate-binding domain-containing protein [Vibrio]EIE5864822.1 LysR family transcriptional regulator [Vibrio alginolyticus]ELA6639226.1 LysR family transcriptional regulator [Vibrio alginolyticus]ELK9268912.1 LysR family transcriptional regulator [Vibrio alginolyticus]ELN6905905.1 LysR family transcriptional regulator [Vibrio alginolyticus]EME3979378.1 LysR family transcriptional regulator [Vibrio alginolyticus]